MRGFIGNKLPKRSVPDGNKRRRKMELKKGEYLEDILLKEGILDIDRRIEEDER